MAGGQTGGALLIGWIAETRGVHVAFAVAGGVPLVAAVVVGINLARQRRLRLRFDLRRPWRLIRIDHRK